MRTIFLFSVLFSMIIFGIETVRADAAEISIETDPATFAFSGYAAHIRVQPEESPWVIGLGGYALKFPDIMKGLVISPSSDNIKIKLNSGIGLFLDRYLSDSKDDGLFAGVQLARHSLSIENKNFSGSDANYNAFIVMPRIGYRWNIGSSGLYVLPWAGLGYVSTLGDEPKVGTQSYSVKQWLPFGTLHLGYQF